MKLDKELLKRVANNARLNLKESEIKEFLPQLKEILEAFSKLDKIRTDKVEPSFHPLEIKDVFREDIPGKSLSQEEALSLTKHKKNGYFKGPRAV